jgi:hypothetical protein
LLSGGCGRACSHASVCASFCASVVFLCAHVAPPSLPLLLLSACRFCSFLPPRAVTALQPICTARIQRDRTQQPEGRCMQRWHQQRDKNNVQQIPRSPHPQHVKSLCMRDAKAVQNAAFAVFAGVSRIVITWSGSENTVSMIGKIICELPFSVCRVGSSIVAP